MIGKKILSYEIISLIGEGGMGNVYLAEHVQLGRKVAVKSLHQQLVKNESLRARFKQEASTMAHLQHPGIVSLYDYVEEEDGLYLVMELVDGKPLDEYIRNVSGPIPAERAVPMMTKILDAFAYAHSKGIVHRDIKPSNILLMNNGEVKILDFGIAKMLSEAGNKLTKTGTQMGTVFYMSPEQVQGKEVDIRSDIYALGVTFFQMLTGVCPYDGMTTEYEVYGKIVNDPLPPASAFYPGIPTPLDHIIAKATMKTREQRFQNCMEFMSILNAPLNSGFVNPPPVHSQANTQFAHQQPVITQAAPGQSNKTPILTKSDKANTIAIIAFAVACAAVLLPWILRDHEFFTGLILSSVLFLGALVMGIIGLVRKNRYHGISWLFGLGAILLIIPLVITDVIRANDYSRYILNEYDYMYNDETYYSAEEKAMAIADSVAVADSSLAAEVAAMEEAAATLNSSVTINSSWQEHNVYVSGEKGMKIHLSFDAYNLMNTTCYARLFFYTEDGYAIYNDGNYSDQYGKLSAYEYFIPSYENSNYSDLSIFIPYSAFDMSSMSGTYQVQAIISNENENLGSSDFMRFTYSN